MKTSIVLVTAGLLVGAAGMAQVRITSFDSNGELAWTNSILRGLYGVESASTPTGPWNLLGTVADLDGAKTNRIAFQPPLTNAPAFYRVGWIPPDPNGVWDYRAYDNHGTLVITGQLSLVTGALLATNPLGYRVGGSWNLGYTGPQTNAPWWLRPQIGTGYLSGTVEFHTAFLRLRWPTNRIDDNIQLLRDIWANTYTGTWNYDTWVGPYAGPFSAVRMNSTSLTNNP